MERANLTIISSFFVVKKRVLADAGNVFVMPPFLKSFWTGCWRFPGSLGSQIGRNVFSLKRFGSSLLALVRPASLCDLVANLHISFSANQKQQNQNQSCTCMSRACTFLFLVFATCDNYMYFILLCIHHHVFWVCMIGQNNNIITLVLWQST